MVKCYVNRCGKDFLQYEEARELVRGIGLQSYEVREPSPWEENVLMHAGIPSERWACATLVVSC
jgi:hypothetical protein